MLAARAATRSTVTSESIDPAAINAFAGRVSGMASVGTGADQSGAGPIGESLGERVALEMQSLLAAALSVLEER
jgi:hypothetical protein